jgi:hypothetical protein
LNSAILLLYTLEKVNTLQSVKENLMNTFANAVNNQTTYTENGMRALKSTSDPCVDLFFKVGASRGQNIVPDFAAAYASDRDLANRIMLWARDARKGAGERQLFRDMLNWLEFANLDDALRLMKAIPELGRWDDLLAVKSAEAKRFAAFLIKQALAEGNGLCAKWMPRKGVEAAKLRGLLGMSPKVYRKTLVNLTKVVETQMCAHSWDTIEFSKVPSVAAARYRAAFIKHTPELYTKYVDSLAKGKTKVNAGAIYPYEVLRSLFSYYIEPSASEISFIKSQWEALPNYIGNAKILPMVDVSGSMMTPVGKNLTAMQVAISLGLYCADKNTGKFKDMFLTFSEEPSIDILRGNIYEKVSQLRGSSWGFNTNLVKALNLVLNTAVQGKVPQEEMPEVLMIFSDMQFDECITYGDSAVESIRRNFETAGYKVPQIVFWNLKAYGNVPVSANEQGVALVSGFSPSIMTSILGTPVDRFSPRNIMLETLLTPRYNY